MTIFEPFLNVGSGFFYVSGKMNFVLKPEKECKYIHTLVFLCVILIGVYLINKRNYGRIKTNCC